MKVAVTPLHGVIGVGKRLFQRQATVQCIGHLVHAPVAGQDVKGQPAAQVAKQGIQHLFKRVRAALKRCNAVEKCLMTELVLCHLWDSAQPLGPDGFFGAKVAVGVVDQLAQNGTHCGLVGPVDVLMGQAVEHRHQLAVLLVDDGHTGFKILVPRKNLECRRIKPNIRINRLICMRHRNL